jgi:hypothetical protein
VVEVSLFLFQAENQEEMINILQDSVNIAQKEQQELQQKLKNAVSLYKNNIVGTILQVFLDLSFKFHC